MNLKLRSDHQLSSADHDRISIGSRWLQNLVRFVWGTKPLFKKLPIQTDCLSLFVRHLCNTGPSLCWIFDDELNWSNRTMCNSFFFMELETEVSGRSWISDLLLCMGEGEGETDRQTDRPTIHCCTLEHNAHTGWTEYQLCFMTTQIINYPVCTHYHVWQKKEKRKGYKTQRRVWAHFVDDCTFRKGGGHIITLCAYVDPLRVGYDQEHVSHPLQK